MLHWKPAKKIKLGVVFGAKFGPNYVQCCEKSKETGNIIRFFFIFYLGLPFKKQEAVAVKPPEWKFIAIMVAKNTKF